MFTTSGRRPVILELRSSKGFIILTVSFAVFTDVFLYGIIVPVLPFALSSRAGVDTNQVQHWISVLLAIYGATLLVTSPVWGVLTDRWSSRRTPFIAGIVFLGGATALFCVGRNLPILACARALQGASAALVWTVGLPLLVDTVGISRVGLAMGHVELAMSAGFLFSPLLGGVVYREAGYYAVFGMAFGLLGLDILLRLVMIEKKFAAKWVESDTTAEAQVQTDIARQEDVLADQKGEKAAEQTDEPEHLSQESTSDVVATDATHTLHRVPPIIKILRHPRLLCALFGTLIHAVITTSFDSTLPLLVNEVFHWDSLGAGLIFLPLLLPSFLGPLVGAASDKYGPKLLAAGGFLSATAFLSCLQFVTENTTNHKVMLCGLLAGVGFSMALVLGPVMADVALLVEIQQNKAGKGSFGPTGAYGQAYALMNMAFSGGAIIGPIFGGFLKDNAGWGTAGWSLGVLSAFTAVVTFVFVGGPVKLDSLLRPVSKVSD